MKTIERVVKELEISVGRLREEMYRTDIMYVEKKAKANVGDVGKFGPNLYVKISDTKGAGQKNWKYIGKAPDGWEPGDPHPYEEKAQNVLDELGLEGSGSSGGDSHMPAGTSLIGEDEAEEEPVAPYSPESLKLMSGKLKAQYLNNKVDQVKAALVESNQDFEVLDLNEEASELSIGYTADETGESGSAVHDKATTALDSVESVGVEWVDLIDADEGLYQIGIEINDAVPTGMASILENVNARKAKFQDAVKTTTDGMTEGKDYILTKNGTAVSFPKDSSEGLVALSKLQSEVLGKTESDEDFFTFSMLHPGQGPGAKGLKEAEEKLKEISAHFEVEIKDLDPDVEYKGAADKVLEMGADDPSSFNELYEEMQSRGYLIHIDFLEETGNVIAELYKKPSPTADQEPEDQTAGETAAPEEPAAYVPTGNENEDTFAQFASGDASPQGTMTNLLEMTSMAGGSTGAKMVRAKYQMKDGSERTLKGVFKAGGTPGHAAEENAVNAIYRAAGVAAAETMMVDNGNEVGLLSKWLDGKMVSDLPESQKDLAKKQVQKNFILDAWLANWDVTGASLDNLMLAGGKVHRIDNGGGGRFRAQGGSKGAAFGAEVKELETMRDPTTLSGKVFSGLSDKEVADQFKALKSKKKLLLDEAKKGSPQLASILSKRWTYLENWANSVTNEGASGAGSTPSTAKLKPAPGTIAAMAAKSSTGAAKDFSTADFDPINKPLGKRVNGGYTEAEKNQSRAGITAPAPKTVHKQALSSFQSSGYASFNAALRKQQPLDAKQMKMLAAMDDYFTGIPKRKMKGTRSTSPSMLEALFNGIGLPDMKIESPEDANTVMPEYGMSKIDLLKNYLVDATFSERGYASTTTGHKENWGWGHSGNMLSSKGGADVQIMWEGDVRAADLNNIPGYHSVHPGENEITLPRNTQHRIKDVRVVKVGGSKAVVRLYTEVKEHIDRGFK
jgi:hypothetical protein